jgi:hypothetical protein
MSNNHKMMESTSLPLENKRSRLPSLVFTCWQAAKRMLKGLAGFIRLTEKEQEDAGIYPSYQHYK